MRHLPIKEYLRIKEIRTNAPAIFTKHGEVRVLNGVVVTRAEFDRLLPPPYLCTLVTSFAYNYKGNNIDTTKAWMNDIKSY